ncbi:hypothetical protein AAEP93_008019 [Penicillium crustosum]
MASKHQDPPPNPWIASDGSPLRGHYWMRIDPKVQPNYWVQRKKVCECREHFSAQWPVDHVIIVPVLYGSRQPEERESTLPGTGEKTYFGSAYQGKETSMWDCRLPWPISPDRMLSRFAVKRKEEAPPENPRL